MNLFQSYTCNHLFHVKHFDCIKVEIQDNVSRETSNSHILYIYRETLSNTKV